MDEAHMQPAEIGVDLMTVPVYSTLFACLHDESKPIGRIGRGTHYSVFRAIQWKDALGSPLLRAQTQDFAVIWDEDHDERVIKVVEEIYIAGLLSPVRFVGERKGILTVIVDARFYGAIAKRDPYSKQLTMIGNGPIFGDSWPVHLGAFERNPDAPTQIDADTIVQDSAYRTVTYLRHVDALWDLGHKAFQPSYVGDVHEPRAASQRPEFNPAEWQELT